MLFPPLLLQAVEPIARKATANEWVARTAELTPVATEVVPEIMEGSLMLASHALLVLGMPLKEVLRRIRTVREARYGLFRGYFHGATDHAESGEDLQPRLHSVVLVKGSAAIGKRPAELGLEPGAISSVRRGGRRNGIRHTHQSALTSGD